VPSVTDNGPLKSVSFPTIGLSELAGPVPAEVYQNVHWKNNYRLFKLKKKIYIFCYFYWGAIDCK